jgi:predicted MPP superfamily phosphohydrolase
MGGKRIGRRRFLVRAFWATVAAGVGGAAYSTLVEPKWILVTRTAHSLPGLAPELVGRTIAQLSDLHLGLAGPSYVERCVKRTLEVGPDLIVLTGDYVGRNNPQDAELVADLLAELTAPLGVFAVSGNHDWSVYRSGARPGEPLVMELLAERGVRDLDNEAVPFGRGGERTWLAGLGDLWAGECRVEQTLRELPRKGARIVLSHNPDSVDAIAAEGADLVLSGHTHGGQVDLPVFGPPLLPVRRRERYSGLYRVGERTRLYVSNGLGWLIRVRFRARPEIALHTLHG